ncbi:Uncharacterized protein ESCO_000024 [Escovopsis weberi]|uniref:Copper acquisition factor BIM1-like domain-containing protein n=1 Tax=Escovopsis weberi TaxID=150374 RepID=A0A0M8N2V7_ESCWE|nr:Uncharacterized protein ESCO_000024 [Escovopsis weberi]
MWSPALINLALAALASAHIVLTYPGTRGNNLITNDSWPFGMQWDYPCGGLGTSRNRTYWPTTGGAISYQPGWESGHMMAMSQINLGYGTDGPDNGPKNMSNIMVKPFQILGPTNAAYPGTICLPQVPLPAGAQVKAGDLATIQVVELAQHGGALYACVDIIFVEPNDPRLPEVNETNCFNSSHIGFADVYTIVTKPPILNNPVIALSAAAKSTYRFFLGSMGWLPLLAGALWFTIGA